MPADYPSQSDAMSEALPVLYQDKCLVAVQKPSGMLVHRTALDRHETRIAMTLVRDQLGRRVFPVHRLDKPTSGVLLFALDPDSARILGEAFTQHRVRKDYLAIVRGWPPLGGIIDHPLKHKEDNRGRKIAHLRRMESAMTLYHRLADTTVPVSVDGRYLHTRYSLARLRPITGRRHQIRRHLKTRSHPIIGDSNYGKGIHNRFFAEQYGVRRLLLCAERLVIPHPLTGETVDIRALPDLDMCRVAREIGLELPAHWQSAEVEPGLQ